MYIVVLSLFAFVSIQSAAIIKSNVNANSPRTLLAILNSNVMNQDNRNTWVNAAINKFKFNFEKLQPAQIPEAQLYTYTSGTPVQTQNWEPAKNLKYISFSHDTPQHINFETLLSNGNTMFNGKQGGGVYTILIGGHSVDPANTLAKVESLANELKQKQVKINIVEFPTISQNRDFALSLFNKAATVTGGSVSHAEEHGKSFATALDLIHGLDANVKLYRPIAEKVIDDLRPKAVDMAFTVDASLINATIRAFWIQSGNDAFTGNSVQLHPPKGTAKVDSLDQVPDYKIDGLSTHLNSQEFIGQWHFVAKTIDTPESLIGIVEVVL
ncbi:unnamed protein product [Oppiella nova]|uniref:Uncharacterized protein n=1 Tax=Oppiella nova TaxID=334625 RepID=A0A7R9MIG6_9ACAR|nr:unnamed protein product [Oppiella nova]CAG2177984.1 unnamed protein product [Oppiella nova]